jgi:hypothetical protein
MRITPKTTSMAMSVKDIRPPPRRALSSSRSSGPGMRRVRPQARRPASRPRVRRLAERLQLGLRQPLSGAAGHRTRMSSAGRADSRPSHRYPHVSDIGPRGPHGVLRARPSFARIRRVVSVSRAWRAAVAGHA